jgi:hypothetical protein
MNKVLVCDIIIKLLIAFMVIVIAFELNPTLSAEIVTFFQHIFNKISEYTQKVETEEGTKFD